MIDPYDHEKIVSAYWKEARRYVAFDQDWFAFRWEHPARKRWDAYFKWRFGFLPAGMIYLTERKIKEFLVPCEAPQDFDASYTVPRP